MKKRFVFVTFLIAIALTQIPVSRVRAEDTILEPVSGSDCDPTTFVYDGHTIAEGFAVCASADLPFGVITQIKFGGAVAGLGDPWVESGIGCYIEYTPYVKEIRVRVEGDAPYTAIEDTIYDNTGTGGSSVETFPVILEIIGAIFNAWQIYAWLSEVYQLPPVAEWDYNGHWSEAIVRQKTEPGYYPFQEWANPNNPRLQTACANVWGYFYEGSSRGLNVTAQAEIYLQKDSVVTQGIVHEYIGTYEVSFQVSVPVSVYTLTISPSGGGSTDPPSGTYTYSYGESVNVTASAAYHYEFKHWFLDGANVYDNPITVTMNSDHDLKPYFAYQVGEYWYPIGCPILSVYDGTEHVLEGLLDIYNPDGIDVTASHVLIHTPEPVEHRYLMRLTEHEQTHSHIDQEQLYATLKDGTEIKLPLVSAVHSEDGDVLYELLLSDDVRADTLGADHNNGTSEWIDLEFVAPEGLEIETFTFVIEGHNPISKW